MNTRVLANHIAVLSPQDQAKLPVTDWTPRDGACDFPGHKHPVDAEAWDVEPWKTLLFSIDDPSYYQYRITRDDSGILVEARGDLNCNGIFSQFARRVTPDGAGQLYSKDDLE